MLLVSMIAIPCVLVASEVTFNKDVAIIFRSDVSPPSRRHRAHAADDTSGREALGEGDPGRGNPEEDAAVVCRSAVRALCKRSRTAAA